MELSKEQKQAIITNELMAVAKMCFTLQISAKACQNSGDTTEAEGLSKQAEKCLLRKESLEKQLADL